MIQDIAPHKMDNQFHPERKIQDEDRVMILVGKNVLVKEGDEVDFPTYSKIFATNPTIDRSDFEYLFSIDSEGYFALIPEEKVKEPSGYAYAQTQGLRDIKTEPRYRTFALYTAIHLVLWYRENRFCGKCGRPLSHSKDERCMVCECGFRSYPRIMPAVIVGVKNGNQLLLTRYRTGYKHNALVAGFTEIGETLEETVSREVMEEAGIHVKNITYYKSQPWGTAKDILAGFYCDVDGSEEIKMDENELKYAAWVNREDIVLQPDDFSLTNEMMMKFKNGEI